MICTSRTRTDQTVHSSISLVLEIAALALAELDGSIYETGVSWLVCGSQDQGRVGSSILTIRLLITDKRCHIGPWIYLWLVNIDC